MSCTRRSALAILTAASATALRAEARPVLVFAAASLQGVLNACAGAWQRDTGKSLRFSYANSAALVRQLEQGAPADIFASADLDWMDHAQKQGLIVPESRRSRLGNRLVLVAAKADPLALTLAPGVDLAGALGQSRLAMGHEAAPFGKYARLALTTLGLWQALAPRTAATDTPRAALALVVRGEARLAIVYATDALVEPDVRVVATFPAVSHPPVVYPFALTRGGNHPDAAAFLAYLDTPPARTVLEAAGFTLLP